MEIINALPEHIGQIAALEALCFEAPWPPDMISRLRERFIVAAEGDAVLGYAALSTVLDEASLDKIAVAPASRRQGIGKALLDAVIARCRAQGMATLTLEVRASNQAAIALYENARFAPVGRRNNYYEKPREDAMIMTLVM
ncbi:MAG: ribosomal protein S18-alanine N-acetyltransferase [Oscillospiraceae bacterium]|nr:ribosomal protein S18-alanine N-acetyltransferase [Oscillospiraceae bacterium]